MITSYEIAEYATCPRRAYYLHTMGCTTVQMASQTREHVRVLHAFNASTAMQNATNTHNQSLEHAITHTRAFLTAGLTATPNQETKAAPPPSSLRHAVISCDDIVAAYIPLCTWNTTSKAWELHFPTASAGLRPEHKIYGASALIHCEQLGIPVARVLLHSLVVNEKAQSVAEHRWHTEDISAALRKYRAECEALLQEITTLLTSAEASNEHAWKGCEKRYCDACKTEQDYSQDDVRTLRKSKRVVDDLLDCNITRIQDIPLQVELHTSARRQVKAVRENRRLFFRKEIRNFLYKLAYPRYYLDFEGQSTAVPLFQGIKAGGFIPFLFSMQWQNYDADAVHTQLWGMPPASDERLAMWQQLKPLLQEAQSIIVYNRNFEDEMIRHLAQHGGEDALGETLTEKIVDLQELFFYLSVYDPRQKGKISLKTLANVWLANDYSAYTVQDGMEANYFFTAMGDEKQGYLTSMQEHAYPATLLKTLRTFDTARNIRLQDIAEYCKYDTAVMIRLISLLEQEI